MSMRVIAGGEYDALGVYAGEVLSEDVPRGNRLVRVDAILVYPTQRAIMTDALSERMPLPYGAVVRMRPICLHEGVGAECEAQYMEQLERALTARIELCEALGDGESAQLLRRRVGRREAKIDGYYARK